jgi:uncharacterized membrane protein YfcA
VLAFTGGQYALGVTAALIVGLSKTAIPGAGLLATPLIAMIFKGREVPGATLPILLVADLFATRWYRDSARWDLLKPLTPWVALGFVGGTVFFITVTKNRSINVAIAVMILVMVLLQVLRLLQKRPPAKPSTSAAAFFGATGGLATFVSNNAGPIMNAHFVRLGLGKRELVGTSSWFYFAVNVAKIPIYVALGHFFTRRGLGFDLRVVPGAIVGLLAGRKLFPHVPQKLFLGIVLALSAAASIKLLIGT